MLQTFDTLTTPQMPIMTTEQTVRSKIRMLGLPTSCFEISDGKVIAVTSQANNAKVWAIQIAAITGNPAAITVTSDVFVVEGSY